MSTLPTLLVGTAHFTFTCAQSHSPITAKFGPLEQTTNLRLFTKFRPHRFIVLYFEVESKLNAGTGKYTTTAMSKSLLSSKAFWAKSLGQMLLFESVTDRHTSWFVIHDCSQLVQVISVISLLPCQIDR